MIEIFEKATRQRLRFQIGGNEGPQGQMNTEDLWSLSLTTLNALAVNLHKKLQETDVSFISDKTEANEKLQLQFDVVKRIIDVRLEERDAAKLAAEKKERRKVLLEALADRRDEALKSKTEEEILKELEELDK